MADSTAERFARYHESPASHIRYEQAQRNLAAMHDLDRPRTALDAAGGNGLNTEWLLRKGFRVTLLDTDPQMLEQARERLGKHDLLERCELVEGSLEEAAQQLPAETFDLILCHHAIEYTDQAPKVLAGFGALAAPGGELSLITLNPVSEVIRAIVFRRDAELAHKKLDDLSYDAKWFGQAMLYPFERVVDWCEKGGWTLHDYRGIRVLVDYLADALDAQTEEAALRFEHEIAAQEPYRRFGRYYQFCFRKQPAA